MHYLFRKQNQLFLQLEDVRFSIKKDGNNFNFGIHTKNENKTIYKYVIFSELNESTVKYMFVDSLEEHFNKSIYKILIAIHKKEIKDLLLLGWLSLY